MVLYCKTCVTPIEPPDQHEHCVACLGFAHAEAALEESDCRHCADLLRTHRNVARGSRGACQEYARLLKAEPPFQTQLTICAPLLHRSSEAMAQHRSLQPGGSPGLGGIMCCGHNGRIDSQLGLSGLWSEPQSRWHISHLDLEAVFLTLKDYWPD
ncbi:hypothetical protein G5714_008807 [Onychostoma macrolepis]|uniref:Uncharacterized protein n=1 Tax=Onychostoma macrolepis TaxID=369639 RepID=A0A7J6CSF0_9TELE|nr:hypothetical protein G5714_008807 [Onychostoma macrolepis]